jgi:hypothetical protein
MIQVLNRCWYMFQQQFKMNRFWYGASHNSISSSVLSIPSNLTSPATSLCCRNRVRPPPHRTSPTALSTPCRLGESSAPYTCWVDSPIAAHACGEDHTIRHPLLALASRTESTLDRVDPGGPPRPFWPALVAGRWLPWAVALGRILLNILEITPNFQNS